MSPNIFLRIGEPMRKVIFKITNFLLNHCDVFFAVELLEIIIRFYDVMSEKVMVVRVLLCFELLYRCYCLGSRLKRS